MSTLEFAFAKEDITPAYGAPLSGYFNPRPNKGVYDRLALKAAVFRNGSEYAAIVSYDLCLLDSKFLLELDGQLKAAGSPVAGKTLYCATHTHTGPFTNHLFGFAPDPAYMKELADKTVFALNKACANLAPAELYTAETECRTLAFNRRFIMKNGKTLTNPGKRNPEIDHPERDSRTSGGEYFQSYRHHRRRFCVWGLAQCHGKSHSERTGLRCAGHHDHRAAGQYQSFRH